MHVAPTPAALVQRLCTEIRGVLGMIDIRATLVAQAIDPAPSTPEQFTAFVKAEIAKWARAVKTAGIKPE